MEFRDLKANEIDCRVAQVFEKDGQPIGLTLLLYKDARVDMNILDETVGSMDWQREHQVVDGRLCCTISIWDDDKKQWVKKQDVGTESMTEKDKGQFSDSFKRAGFNVGIGRELYTAPLIYIKAENIKKWYQNSKGKWAIKDRMRVKHIETIDGKIEQLIIFNDTTREDVFIYGVGK